jgi:hypothetical protein
VVDVSPKGWNEPVELQYFNTDTLAQKQIDLILRHDRVLEKSNGRYAVEIMSPYGDVLCDTLSINILPNAQRNRLGETNSLVKGIEFTKTGDYHFTVSPLQNTTGIWSVGIELK